MKSKTLRPEGGGGNGQSERMEIAADAAPPVQPADLPPPGEVEITYPPEDMPLPMAAPVTFAYRWTDVPPAGGSVPSSWPRFSFSNPDVNVASLDGYYSPSYTDTGSSGSAFICIAHASRIVADKTVVGVLFSSTSPPSTAQRTLTFDPALSGAASIDLAVSAPPLYEEDGGTGPLPPLVPGVWYVLTTHYRNVDNSPVMWKTLDWTQPSFANRGEFLSTTTATGDDGTEWFLTL